FARPLYAAVTSSVVSFSVVLRFANATWNVILTTPMRASARELSLHGHRPVLLLDGAETEALVQLRHALLGAETDRGVPLLFCPREQCVHQLTAEPAAPAARDDRDRQLGGLRIDEAEPRRTLREEAVPGGADRAGLPGDQTRIAGPAPVVHVAGDGQGRSLVQAPVGGVLEHVAKEADILRPGGNDHLVAESPSNDAAMGRFVQEVASCGISTGVKRNDDQRTEFGHGLRARLLRRRALRFGPGRVRLPAPLV